VRTTSNKHGQFRLDDLLLGVYGLTVEVSDFVDARSRVTVVVSSVREISVTLHPASARPALQADDIGRRSDVAFPP
jgi:hypothetical protein